MGPREDSAVDVDQARDHKVRPSSRSSTEAIAASVCVRQPTITEVEGSHVIMISQPDAVTDVLDGVYRELVGDCRGAVADYIPELAVVDPDSFAICLSTCDGTVYEVGDSRKRFAIQSISKPFSYALALADRGLATVAERVDVEPSGEAFNEISLDPTTAAQPYDQRGRHHRHLACHRGDGR